MSRAREMSLRKRIVLGFSIPTLIVFVSLILNNALIKDMQNQVSDYAEFDLPEAKTLQQLATASYSMRMPVLVIARTPEPEVRKRLAQEIGEKREIAEAAYKAYREAILTDEGRAIYEEVSGLWGQWISVIGEIYQLSESGDFQAAHEMQLSDCEPVFNKYENTLESNIKMYEERIAQSTTEKLEVMRSKLWYVNLMGVGLLVAIISAIVFAYMSITKPIRRFIIELQRAAKQTRKGAEDLSDSSVNLADGATEQATAVEETSASLREISDMVETNTGYTNDANTLSVQSHEIVKAASEQMCSLIQSMEDISNSSEKTQNIVKTIDEIAFQTNLLALNAAVEAARAGEAGAGFAVVAEEVRSLAMRASSAASETSRLIENSANQINHGAQQAGDANQAFVNVEKTMQEISRIITRIAEGSKEQSSGIVQLNDTVSEISKVINKNSETADTSSESARRLSEQSSNMTQSLEVFSEFAGLSKGLKNR